MSQSDRNFWGRFFGVILLIGAAVTFWYITIPVALLVGVIWIWVVASRPNRTPEGRAAKAERKAIKSASKAAGREERMATRSELARQESSTPPALPVARETPAPTQGTVDRKPARKERRLAVKAAKAVNDAKRHGSTPPITGSAPGEF